MTQKLYSELEANHILNQFPQEIIAEFLTLASRFKSKPSLVGEEHVYVPEGWAYNIFGNCIVIRYQDGEQERKEFFVPEIRIDFLHTDVIEAKKSIMKRLALGYCSCGKRMPTIQALLYVADLIERKGILNLPFRIFGHILSIPFSIWIFMRPEHQLSIMYNRHPKCL